MHVTSKNLQLEFPYEDKDGEIYSMNSSQETDSQNNNAMFGIKQNPRTQRSPGALLSDTTALAQPDGVLPHCSSDNPPSADCDQNNSELQCSINLMQNFMIKKGLIDSSLNEVQILDLLQKDLDIEIQNDKTQETSTTASPPKEKAVPREGNNPSPLQALDKHRADTQQKRQGTIPNFNQTDSMSEVTIYKKAVKQLDPELDSQIECLLEQTRLEARHKESSSSDELIDTSDEGINDSLLLVPTLIPSPDRDQEPVQQNRNKLTRSSWRQNKLKVTCLRFQVGNQFLILVIQVLTR